MKLLKHAIWFSPSHTLLDIKHFVSAMQFSISRLFPEVPGYDAWAQGTEFEIPFFIFQGENDVVTPSDLARAYFEDVTAPVKGFALIKAAGHFAAFTQPEQFLSEMLAYVRPVATYLSRARLVIFWIDQSPHGCRAFERQQEPLF